MGGRFKQARRKSIVPHFLKVSFVWTLASLLLSGCWDIKDPQDINYFTAIGFDYVDNQYIVYTQMIDFSTVAKMEQGRPEKPLPVWMGKGKGETAASAINNLYETAQLRIFYGHINAIVYSENVIKKGIEPILDLQSRYYEMRYTPWVFGTNAPIEDLMATTSFFNFSPAMSLLHQPQENYKQNSTIQPLTAREFIANLREPGKTSLLPSLGINTKKWYSDHTGRTMMDINGVYVFHEESYRGRLAQDTIIGLRWTQTETNRGPLIIRSEGKVSASVWLEQPKVKITPHLKDDTITYTLEVKLRGNVNEIFQPMPESVMEKYAAKHVREEIQQTFEEGLTINADLLQLEYALYRQKNKQWKKIRDNQQLAADSLDIKVDVDLTTAGKQKMAE